MVWCEVRERGGVERARNVPVRLSFIHNSLSGELPSQLGRLTALTYLFLNYNSLEGTLPSQLGRLTALTHLHLRGNSLEGGLPSALADRCSKSGVYCFH